MRKRIIATRYAVDGLASEKIQRRSGLLPFSLCSVIFDANEPMRILELLDMAKKKVGAVIIDNCRAPGNMSISHKMIDVARQLRRIGIETFFLCKRREDDLHQRFSGCMLWRAHKPLTFGGIKPPVPHIALIGKFHSAVFDAATGKVFDRQGGGDQSEARVAHCLREGIARETHDWPAITKAVKEELSR